MKLKTIAIVAMSLVVFASCKPQKVKESAPQKVETETINPSLLLGENIKTLLDNKTLMYNTESETKYSLSNKFLGDMGFKQADINYERRLSKIIRSICYGTDVMGYDIDNKYAQMLSFLKNKYGDPTKEGYSMSVGNVAKYTGALWDMGDYAISLSTTMPLQEERGTMLVIFTINDDISLFKELFS